MTPGTLDVLLDLRNRRYAAEHPALFGDAPMNRDDRDYPDTIDYDAPTKEHPALRHTLPPEREGGERTELVTLRLPAGYLRKVEAIQAETGELIADVVLRHSLTNVATEAMAIRRKAGA